MLEASAVEVPHSIELLQGLGRKEIDLIWRAQNAAGFPQNP
jgi:hypothetical protein